MRLLPSLLASLLTFALPTNAASWPENWTPPVAVAPEATPSLLTGGEARLVSDGETYLLTTYDSRGARAMRLDADGQIVDRNGIALSRERVIDIAGNGSQWLMTSDVSAWMLDNNGRVTKISTGIRYALAASNGRNFMAWSSFDRKAVMVSADGFRTDVGEGALPSTSSSLFPSDLATNGDVYCIAALTSTAAIVINFFDVSGRPLFAEPKKLLDVPLMENRHLSGLGLARIDGNFRVFWFEYEAVPEAAERRIPWALSYVELTPLGELITAPRQIASGVELVGPYESLSGAIEVTQIGPTDAIVRWWLRGDRYLQTSRACGAAFPSRRGALASNHRTMVLASSDNVEPNRSAVHVRAGAFSCDLAALVASAPELPSQAAPEQRDVSLAAGRHDAVAVWSEQGTRRARRIAHDGRPLAWMQLPEEARTASELRVESDGYQYVAVWLPVHGKAVRFAELREEGAPLAQVVTLDEFAAPSDGVDVEWDGQGYRVVWSADADTFGGNARLLTGRLSRLGALLGPGVTELVAPIPYRRRIGVMLSRGFDTILVGWYEAGTGGGLPCSGCTNPQGVWTLEIDADGNRIGTVQTLSGYRNELQALVWHEGAWYVFSRDDALNNHRVVRIDDAGMRAVSIPFSGEVAAFSMGWLGVGISTASGEIVTLTAALEFDRYSSSWPYRVEEMREMQFAAVPGGSGRVLTIFTGRVDNAPYSGVHRAFVSALDFMATSSRRRAARP